MKFIPFNTDYRLDLTEAKKLITNKTKIVSIYNIYNLLWTINPVEEIENLAHSINAYFIIDGAQSVPNLKTDIKTLNCDFLVFSAHKMSGPTGVGVLYGKKEALEKFNSEEHDEYEFL